MNRKGCFKLVALSVMLVAVIIHFTGCASQTPQGRGQQNPMLVERLTQAERELVLKGQIREGMNKDAVFLAWGKADAVTTGSDRGQATETWRYTTLRPVYYSGYGYGVGYAPYGHRGRRVYPYTGMNLTPDYVSVPSSYVKFHNGRVTSWEADGR